MALTYCSTVTLPTVGQPPARKPCSSACKQFQTSVSLLDDVSSKCYCEGCTAGVRAVRIELEGALKAAAVQAVIATPEMLLATRSLSFLPREHLYSFLTDMPSQPAVSGAAGARAQLGPGGRAQGGGRAGGGRHARVAAHAGLPRRRVGRRRRRRGAPPHSSCTPVRDCTATRLLRSGGYFGF